MHNGWKKICRSVCRKMDVFVQRRRLCNLITSVASVADSGIICSYSVSITWVNFVVLPTRAEEGRSSLSSWRGVCLLQAAFCISLEFPRDREFAKEEAALVANSVTPAERGLQKSPCEGLHNGPIDQIRLPAPRQGHAATWDSGAWQQLRRGGTNPKLKPILLPSSPSPYLRRRRSAHRPLFQRSRQSWCRFAPSICGA